MPFRLLKQEAWNLSANSQYGRAAERLQRPRPTVSPDADQPLNCIFEAVVEVVLPEDRRHAWVGQNVCIARLLLAGREGPVLLRAACKRPESLPWYRR